MMPDSLLYYLSTCCALFFDCLVFGMFLWCHRCVNLKNRGKKQQCIQGVIAISSRIACVLATATVLHVGVI